MITIGPVAVPVTVLVLAAAMSAALFVSRRRGGIHRARVESTVQYMLLVGILAARLSFVFTYWDTYRATPLSVIDIRDGGFHAWSGLIAGAGVALIAAARDRLLLRPLMLSLAAGVTTAAAAVALAWGLLDAPPDRGLPAGTFTRLDGTPMQFEALCRAPGGGQSLGELVSAMSSGDAGACRSSSTQSRCRVRVRKPGRER